MKTNLTTGPVTRRLIVYTLPLLVGNLFQQLYTLVDSLVVGRFVGANALAAVSTVAPVVMLLTTLADGFIVGASTLVARYYGAKDHESVRRCIHTGVQMTFILMLFIAAAGIATAWPVLRLMQTPDEIMADAVLYLQIIFVGTIFQGVYLFFTASLRAMGDSRTPLYFLVLACLSNSVLDVLLVAGFGWGVFGAAIATAFAQLLATVCCVLYSRKKYAQFYHFRPGRKAYSKPHAKELVQYGLPCAAQSIIGSLGAVLMQSTVNTYGANVMAGYSAAYRIDNFIMLPVMSMGNALALFTAQNIGARQIKRTRRGLLTASIVCNAIAVVLSVLIYIFAPALLALFVKEHEVEAIRHGVDCLRVLAPLFILCSQLNLMISFFRGLGKLKTALNISALQIIVRVGVAMGFTRLLGFGVEAIWWSMPSSWVVCTIVSFICLWYFNRQPANLATEKPGA